MAYGSSSQVDDGASVGVVDGTTANGVRLPEGVGLAGADLVRAGPDLIVETPDGRQILVRDYFSSESAPALMDAAGARLDGTTVMSIAGPPAPGLMAQAAAVPATAPIGRVDVASGAVSVTRGGVRLELDVGDPVFQGDVVRTGSSGTVGIVFEDDTVASLGGSSELVLDELVYDPATEEGSLNLTAVGGLFVVVSGAIAKTSPDAMVINTPAASIGIRGTTVYLKVAPEGVWMSLDAEDGGTYIGQIIVVNDITSVSVDFTERLIYVPNWVSEAVISEGTSSFKAEFAVPEATLEQVLGELGLGEEAGPDGILTSDPLMSPAEGMPELPAVPKIVPPTIETDTGVGGSAGGGAGNSNFFNLPPAAVNDSAVTTEAAAVTVNVLANDTNPGGGRLTATLVGGPSLGSVTGGAGGAFTFDPSGQFEFLGAGQSTVVTFTYALTDAAGNAAARPGTVSITVTGLNDLPTGIDVVPLVEEVKENVDTGAIMTVTVIGDPDLPPDNGTPQFDLSLTSVLDPAGEVFIRDETYKFERTDGDPTKFTLVLLEPLDFEALAPTDAGATIEVPLTILVEDLGGGPVQPFETSFLLRDQNDPPVALNELLVTAPDDVFTGNLLADSGMGLAFDQDGDALTVTAVDGSEANVGAMIPLGDIGHLTVGADGVFNFDPADEFDSRQPNASFTYTVSDGELTATARVTILVNVPRSRAEPMTAALETVVSDEDDGGRSDGQPVAEDDAVVAMPVLDAEDDVIARAVLRYDDIVDDLYNLLANDRDADGAAVVFGGFDASGLVGELVDTGDGTLSYTLREGDDVASLFDGDSFIDRFQYTVFDRTVQDGETADGASDVATVDIVIPTALAEGYQSTATSTPAPAVDATT